MAVLYSNNASSALSASITSSATSFSVTTGHGDKFPVISNSDYFYVTLLSTGGAIEIVKVTARSADTFTVVRAQDGTTGTAFTAGDKVELRITKAMLDDYKTDTRTGYLPLSGGTITGKVTFNPNSATVPAGWTGSSDGLTIVNNTIAASDGTRIGAATSLLLMNVGSDVGFDSQVNIDFAAVDGNSLLGGVPQVRIGYSAANNTLANTSPDNEAEGYFRIATRTAGAAGTLVDRVTFDATGIANFSGTLQQGGNQVLHAGNWSSYAAAASHTHSYLPLSGGTLTGASTVSVSSWVKWALETTGVTAKARQGSDGNGLNFTTNALYNAGWAEDDTTKKKMAYIQHLGNGRHEFRTAAAGAGISWVTGLTVDENAVNSLVALQQGGNQVLHAANYNSYSPTLTGGSASGTWGIRVTGFANAGSPRLYSTDSSYNYDAANPYYGYLTYVGANSRWRFQVSPATPAAVEVAYADTSGSLVGFTNSNANNAVAGPDTLTNNGIGYVTSISLLGQSDGALYAQAYSTSWVHQIYGDYRTGQLAVRGKNSGTWQGWRTVLDSGNYSSYALPLSGGTVTGSTTFNAQVLNVGNGGADTGITVNAGSGSGEYGRIRFSHGGSNIHAIHAFSATWQNGNLWATSTGAINLAGSTGVTLGPWNDPTLASDGSGNVRIKTSLLVAGNTAIHAGNYSSYALPASERWYQGWVNSPGWDANALPESRSGFTYSNNAPLSGCVVHFGAGGYGIQLNGDYSGDSFSMRSRNGDVGTWRPWKRVLTDYNYSSYALPLSGGTLSGLVRVTRSLGGAVGATPTTPYSNNHFEARTDDGTATVIAMHRNGYSHVALVHKNTNELLLNMNSGEHTVIHSGNYTSYTASRNGSGYLTPENWTQLNGFYGLYAPNNGAHFYPNPGTYGPWKVIGTRNGWNGLEFDAANGSVCLMVDPNSNNTGFHNPSYGWQILWTGGSLYCYKNSYGGGTQAIVLDAANYGNYALPLGGGTVTGASQFRTNKGAGTYSGSTDTHALQAYCNDNGTAAMSFHRAGLYAVNMGLDPDNVLRIGGWSASANRFQMDMSGNLTMAGNVTAYSDERLKKDWVALPSDFVERLAQTKNGTYTRIDSEERQAGSSAQDWQTLLPEVVTADNEGHLGLAYGNAALVSAIELAKRVVEQDARIAKLESLINQLIGD